MNLENEKNYDLLGHFKICVTYVERLFNYLSRIHQSPKLDFRLNVQSDVPMLKVL